MHGNYRASPVEERGDWGMHAVTGRRDVVDPGGEVSQPRQVIREGQRCPKLACASMLNFAQPF